MKDLGEAETVTLKNLQRKEFQDAVEWDIVHPVLLKNKEQM